MRGLIYDGEVVYDLTTTDTENLRTNNYVVTNFGFLRLTSNEQYAETWYPTPSDIVPPGWFSLDIHDATYGDFNNDGLDDLVLQPMLFPHVLSHETLITPIFLLQDSQGGFMSPVENVSTSSYPEKHFLYRVGVGDFNGDGYDDYVASSMGEAARDRTESLGGFQSPLVVFGTSDPKFVWTDSFQGFELQTEQGPGYTSGHSMAVGDFNADGLDDWYSQHYAFYGNDQGLFDAEVITPNSLAASGVSPFESQWVWPNINAAVSADFDEDGFDDLIFSLMPAAPDSGLYKDGGDMWLARGSVSGLQDGSSIINLPRTSSLEDNIGTNFMVSADFNGDGHEDILLLEHSWVTDAGDSTRYYNQGSLRLFLGDGRGQFTDGSSAIVDPYSGERTGEGNIHAADINGDGWIDVVLTGYGWNSSGTWNSGPLTDSTTIFLNQSGLLSYVDPSSLAYVQPYQFSGEEDLKEWQQTGVGKFIPVDIGGDGMMDFLGFVDTPLKSWPQAEPIYTYAYVSMAVSPLGRADWQQGEFLRGTASGDKIFGYGGDDMFVSTAGDDYLNGGDGIDTALYPFTRASILKTPNGYSVAGDDLENIERIEFTDVVVALDTDGATSAGGIYRLYKATFNREPDTGGLGYWIAQADAGNKDAVRMAEDFTWSAEFQNLYGITTTDNYGTGTDVSELVTGFYENVLGRSPDAGGLNYYTGVIESREKTVGRVLAEISDSPENYDGTIALIANGIVFDPWVG